MVYDNLLEIDLNLIESKVLMGWFVFVCPCVKKNVVNMV